MNSKRTIQTDMKYFLFFALIFTVLGNDTTYYQLDVYRELNNGYFSNKSFLVSAVHVEGIKKSMLTQEHAFNHSYFVNFTRRTSNTEDIFVICNAALTLNSLHTLAQYIPALIVEYK
jgi:hypothetical protein